MSRRVAELPRQIVGGTNDLSLPRNNRPDRDFVDFSRRLRLLQRFLHKVFVRKYFQIHRACLFCLCSMARFACQALFAETKTYQN